MRKKIISTNLLIFGLIFSLSVNAGGFDGKEINVKLERWDTVSPGQGGSLKKVRDEANVVASDQASPDITGLNFRVPQNPFGADEQWDIDFKDQTIRMVFTTRYFGTGVGNLHEFMYGGVPNGFHFEDTNSNLPDIINVSVIRGDLPYGKSFLPFGFNTELVSFDADNIYVDLNGAMCHDGGMAGMPDCYNESSPTEYDNIIELMVEFAGDSNGNENTRIDAFFDYVEQEYKDYFPYHTESQEVIGYRARHYIDNRGKDAYIGTKGGHLFLYGEQFANFSNPPSLMQDLGNLEQWLISSGL